ncbi:MAG: hypothetical protein ACRCVE_01840 [Plesiomonas sp.]
MHAESFIDGVKVSELNERMARMEANQEHQQRVLDKIVESSEQNTNALSKMTSIMERLSALEPRLAAVERKLWYWAGGLAALVFILSNFDKWIK